MPRGTVRESSPRSRNLRAKDAVDKTIGRIAILRDAALRAWMPPLGLQSQDEALCNSNILGTVLAILHRMWRDKTDFQWSAKEARA